QILSGGGFSLELNGVSVQTASLVATGACHTVKLVQSGTTASLYLDGTLETTLSDGAGTGTVSAFYAGRWANGTGYSFDGTLEDMVISNIASTQGAAVRKAGDVESVGTGKPPTGTPGSPPGGKELILAPNPASSHNVAEIDLPQPATARLVVMDLGGQCVETRDLGPLQAGITDYSLDLSNEAPGIYFLSLQTDTGQGYAPAALFKFAVVR
ncbi:MAG TPA: LamG-like jellyroll fold domain-containing protein, partial [bacterium]|nr:LamG-like jellyroll fold domain-containing protein [bacterium]